MGLTNAVCTYIYIYFTPTSVLYNKLRKYLIEKKQTYLIDIFFFTDYLSVCNNCLLHLTPSTLQSCANSCRKRIKFAGAVCTIHNQIKIYGTICRLCVGNTTIRSIDAETAVEDDEPQEDEVLVIIRENEIILDKHNHFNGEEIEYQHLFVQGGMVGCGYGGDGGGVGELYGPQNIVRRIVENEYDTDFHIQPPNIPIYPTPYLEKYQDEILEAIRSSNLIHDSFNYKANITVFCKYYKNGEGEKEFGGVYYPSAFLELPAYSGSVETHFLSELIQDLSNVMCDRDSKMEGSQWVYMGTEKIVISFIKTLGRSIKKVRDYTPYPPTKRGARSVINLNYKKKPFRIRVDDTAECLLWAFKCYKTYSRIEDETLQTEFVKELTRDKERLPANFWYDMHREDAILPEECKRTGNFALKHFKKMEQLNKTPIALYNMEKAKGDKVTISCILAPSKKILEEFKDTPTCHLLMITDDHVAFIPDMDNYMKSIFGSVGKKRKCYRCTTCFYLFKNEDSLLKHSKEGICIQSKAQPTKLVLKEGAIIPSKKLIDEMMPELTLVADTECYMKDTPSDENDDTDELLGDIEGGTHDTDGRAPGKISSHVPHSVGMMLLDHNLNKISYDMLWGEDVSEKFLDKASSMVDAYKLTIADQRYPIPTLTDEQEKEFQKSERCRYCNIAFKTLGNNKKVRHHDHMVKPIFTSKKDGNFTKYTCISGNYVGASCLNCNWFITHKRHDTAVLFHNFSGYDSNVLLPGMVKSKERMKKIKLMPKGGTGYHMIRYKNLKMIDSCSFMQGGLASLVTLLAKKVDENSSDKKMEHIFPNTVQTIRESRFNDQVIPLLKGKLSYPHGLVKGLEDFWRIVTFPSREDFYDKLTETSISENDYLDAKEIYEVSGCQNLKDLHDLYLMLDVCFLGDCWKDFNARIYEDFQVYPSNYTTGPSLFYAAAMRKSGVDIKLLDDLSMYETFHNSIRGGFTAVNKRHIVTNNIELGEKFDPTIPSSTLLMGDFNSLYAGILREHMPVGGFEYLNDDVVKEYEKDPKTFLDIDVSENAKKGYWVTVDFLIPDELKKLTDDLPLGIINTEEIFASEYTRSVNSGKNGGNRKLVAGHFGLENYGFHIKLLQFYIELGCIITKVHNIIKFDQERLFRPYIDHCLSRRREAAKNNDEVQKRLYKLLANSIYGKCLQSDIKYCTRSVLVEIGEKYSKLIGDVRFKARRWIIKDDVALITKTKPQITLSAPIFIGACVLQLAKLINSSFLLQVAKPSCATFPEKEPYPIRQEDYDLIKNSREYIQDINMVYTDTDSQALEIIYTEQGKYMTHDFLYNNTFLSKYLDRSNFKKLSTDSFCQPSEIGFIKSEVGDNIVHEMICLSPKCYSLLSYERETNKKHVKSAIKGCPSRIGEKVYNHDVFRKILEDSAYTPPQITANHIRRGKICGVNTIRERKTCLSLVENKRFWVNQNLSFGYGHPETYNHGYRDSHIVPGGGCRIKLLDQYDNEDFFAEFVDNGDDFYQVVDVEECTYDTNIATSEVGEIEELLGSYFPEEDASPLLLNGETYNYDVDEINEHQICYM